MQNFHSFSSFVNDVWELCHPMEDVDLKFLDEEMNLTKWLGGEEVVARCCKNATGRKYCTAEISVQCPYLLELTSQCPIKVLLHNHKCKEDGTSRKTTLNESTLDHKVDSTTSQWSKVLQPGFVYRMVILGKGQRIKGKTCTLKMIKVQKVISVRMKLISYCTKSKRSRKFSQIAPRLDSSCSLLDSSQCESSSRKKRRIHPTFALKMVICVASLFQIIIILLHKGLLIGKEWKNKPVRSPDRRGILDTAFSFLSALFKLLFESEKFKAAIARLCVVWDCTFYRYQTSYSNDPQSRFYASDNNKETSIVVVPKWCMATTKVTTPWWAEHYIGRMATSLCNYTLWRPLQMFVDDRARTNEYKGDIIQINDGGEIRLPQMQWQAYSIHRVPGSIKSPADTGNDCRKVIYHKVGVAEYAPPPAQSIIEQSHINKEITRVNDIKDTCLQHVWELYEVFLGNGNRQTMEKEIKSQVKNVLLEFMQCFSSQSSSSVPKGFYSLDCKTPSNKCNERLEELGTESCNTDNQTTRSTYLLGSVISAEICNDNIGNLYSKELLLSTGGEDSISMKSAEECVHCDDQKIEESLIHPRDIIDLDNDSMICTMVSSKDRVEELGTESGNTDNQATRSTHLHGSMISTEICNNNIGNLNIEDLLPSTENLRVKTA